MDPVSQPTTLTATVFATLPAHLRKAGQRTVWADANRGGLCLDCFLEGPAFDRTGNLLMVDVPFGRILKMAPDGTFDLVTEYDGWPYALKIHRDGRIFITDFKHGILVLDPS